MALVGWRSLAGHQASSRRGNPCARTDGVAVPIDRGR